MGAESARALLQLLLRKRKIADEGLRIPARPDPIEEFSSLLAPVAPMDAPPRPAALYSKRDVFRHCEIREQRRLLVNGRDKVRLRCQRIVVLNDAAVHLDGARIRLNGAR